MTKVPNHIWIIMDWNRRWAKQKLLPSIIWHKTWANNVKKITEYAVKLWIDYMTLWALSTDNLKKRNKDEVDWIIKIIDNIESFLDEMIQNWLKFETIWDLSKLPEKSQEILNRVKEKTKNNTWVTLVIALIYWWQDEIIRWIKKFVSEWWDINTLDKNNFTDYLDTWKYPNPELIIRTGWDIRHSWFLLYNSEYSEYYFTQKKWPEFDENELDKAIEFYNSSKRNFWK